MFDSLWYVLQDIIDAPQMFNPDNTLNFEVAVYVVICGAIICTVVSSVFRFLMCIVKGR